MKNWLKLLRPFVKKICVLGMGIFYFTPSFGQHYIDLLRIEYASSNGNDFKTGNGNSAVHEWSAEATVPVPLNPKNTFLTGFLYENAEVTLYNEQPSVSVSTLNLKLGLNQTYSDKWSASYLLLPKFSSDLKQYKSKDFQFGVAALFKYNQSQFLQYKFGAFYNTDLFGPFVTPFLGLYYQKDKWEANILIPRVLDVNYHIVHSIRLGLRFNGAIRSFHLNEPGNGIPQYLSTTNNELGAYVGWVLGRFNVVFMAGRSLGRNYRTFAQDDQLDLAISLIKLGDDRTQLNNDFKDGLVFKVAAIYRMELGKK